MVIVGIVGKPGSGKEEIASYLKQNWGFEVKKLPFFDYKKWINNLKIGKIDEINKETCEKLEINDILSVFDKIDLEKFKEEEKIEQFESFSICKQELLKYDKNIVIFPITSMVQVKYMRKRNYFHLVYLDTPLKLRYTNFIMKYQENLSLENFIELDDFLYTKTQIHDCIEQANFRIQNFNDIKTLYKVIETNRQSIERPFRPDWDTYFMKVAYAIKARSNCMKRSVGAIIMKKKRIIATGYNGTPGLAKNCYENGCERCNSNAKQGIDLHKCLCIHAEESAILETKIALMNEATIYTTLFPCSFCAKIIKHVKIKRVVYDEEFDDKNSLRILKEGGIEICKCELNKYLFNI